MDVNKHGWEVETKDQNKSRVYLFRFLDDIAQYFEKEKHQEIVKVYHYIGFEKIDKTRMVMELLKGSRNA